MSKYTGKLQSKRVYDPDDDEDSDDTPIHVPNSAGPLIAAGRIILLFFLVILAAVAGIGLVGFITER